jgi:L-fucose isomerase-like protein
MIRPVVGCYAVVEATEIGWENAANQLDTLCRRIGEAGMDALKAPEIVRDEASAARVAAFFAAHPADVLQPLIITWSFDHFTYGIWQACRAPIAIRSIPGINTGSTVGGQQLGALLHELEIPHKLYFAPPDDTAVCLKMFSFAAAAALKRRLTGKKIAMIGRRTPGMTPILFDEIEIMEKFGMTVMTLGMDEFRDGWMAKASGAEAEKAWKDISLRAARVECAGADGVQTMKEYLAMKSLARERGLAALAIGTYPECQGTACLPLALLNDEGFPAGCEGDLNSTIMMLLLSELSGKPTHFGEMVDLDLQKNEIYTTHCGAGAPCFADDRGFSLCPVRLADSGVCIRYCAMCEDITYACLVGRRGTYRLCAFEGSPVRTEMVYDGNPLRFRLRTPAQRIWDITAEHGFHHHWITGLGSWNGALKEFTALAGIKGVFPDIE